jgi:hypothetical protein
MDEIIKEVSNMSFFQSTLQTTVEDFEKNRDELVEKFNTEMEKFHGVEDDLGIADDIETDCIELDFLSKFDNLDSVAFIQIDIAEKDNSSQLFGEISKAVEEAIAAKIEATEGKTTTKKPTPKKSTKKPPVVEEEHDQEDIELLAALREAVESVDEKEEDTPPFDVNEEIEDIFAEDETVDEDAMITLDDEYLGEIRAAFKTADASTKAVVKKHLAEYGNKLNATMKFSDIEAIAKALKITKFDEV